MTRKSQYGWMVVGGILCLCGGVVALKLREGNPAIAQTEPAPAPMTAAADDPPRPEAIEKDKDAPKTPGEVKPTHPTETLPPIVSQPQHTPDPAGPPSPPPGPAPELAKAPAPAATTPDAPPPPPSAAPDAAPPSDPLPNPLPNPTDAKDAVPPLPPAVKTDPPPPGPGSIAPPPPTPHDFPRPDAVKFMPPAVVQVGEPPLAGAGPIQSYQVRTNGETMRDIARRTLGAGQRWTDVAKLNPNLRPEDVLMPARRSTCRRTPACRSRRWKVSNRCRPCGPRRPRPSPRPSWH